MTFISEIRNGYTSSFRFQCQICSIKSIIHSENPKESYIPINKALVNGSIAAGMCRCIIQIYKILNGDDLSV